MQCQHQNHCGGSCETPEEHENGLCRACLEASHDREAEQKHNDAMRNALQRIAVAVGLELAEPEQVADAVIAKITGLETQIDNAHEALTAAATVPSEPAQFDPDGELVNRKWYWVECGIGERVQAPAMYLSNVDCFYSYEFAGVSREHCTVLREA